MQRGQAVRQPEARQQQPQAEIGFWEDARAQLSGLPGGVGLNIAYEAVDRHAAGPTADRVALRCLGESGRARELTYGELAELSSRFASALVSLGVARGDRVFVLTGRIPELYVAVLGGLKLGAVICTLFAAFGPEPIAQRLRLGDGRVLVTTPSLHDRKVASGRDGLPELQHVLLTGDPSQLVERPGTDRSPRCSRRRPPTSRRLRPKPRILPCCTSRAAPLARRRAPSTCTAPSSAIWPRPAWFWISGPTTCTGAPRTPAG